MAGARANPWSLASGHGPLHARVRRSLESSLARGEFPPQRAMPSARQLSAMFGVSRTTVDTALAELGAMGLVVAHPRSGLYPAPAGTAARRVGAAPAGSLEPARDAARPAVPPAAGRPVDLSGHLLARTDPWGHRVDLHADHLDHPYPFLPGQMAPGAFPARAWLRACARAMDGPHAGAAVRDAGDGDDPLLVEALVTHVLPSKGITATPDQVLITNGSQQALALLASALLDGGRTVGMEDPGYVDAARIFHRSGAALALFDVDERGVRPDWSVDVDLLYLTPSHQHPTNTTLHADRRAEVLAQAGERDFLVVEDDYDSEMRYRGAPTAPLRAVDTSGRVVYLGTFSKFLAPGLRLGYVVAQPELVAELRTLRYLATKHPSGLDQRALALLIVSGDFHRVLGRHRTLLRRKWAAVAEALEEHLPWPLGPVPSGGLSFWVQGPSGFDATAMAARARELGVLVMPGERYQLGADPPRSAFRLGFSSITPEAIAPGIAALGRAVRESHPHLGRSSRSG